MHGVEDWKSEVKNMNLQILDEVNKGIDTKVEAIFEVKNRINNDVNKIKKDIDEEVNTMDK